jgi:hypothetical protein
MAHATSAHGDLSLAYQAAGVRNAPTYLHCPLRKQAKEPGVFAHEH